MLVTCYIAPRVAVLPISPGSRQLLLNVNVNLVLPPLLPRDPRPALVTCHVSPGVCRIIATLNPVYVELSTNLHEVAQCPEKEKVPTRIFSLLLSNSRH